MYLFKSSVVLGLTMAAFDNPFPKSILDKSQFLVTTSKKSEKSKGRIFMSILKVDITNMLLFFLILVGT